MSGKMIGFHIDMNVAQFRKDYLERWLRYLGGAGYNTILWEVENNVQWETVPECASPDAFTRKEFMELLNLCRELGMESIPLLQTLGHAEYVLKHEPYVGLREAPDRIDQYCPLNPEVVPLLNRWVEEYLEVFGDVKRFHLGADEAFVIGNCPECSAFAERNSISELYIRHVNAVAEPLRERGITPVIWGDMVLAHPEAIEKLSRDIMIFDWCYVHYRGAKKFRVWGEGMRTPDELSANALERFGKHIFPDGKEEGADVFYTTEYLKSQGFDVVTCPSSASHGDSAFAPRLDLHEKNTWDFGWKGMEDASGMMLTSWTVRIHPWELQKSCIDIPGYQLGGAGGGMDGFRDAFAERTFGCKSEDFYAMAGALAIDCPYASASKLGLYKSCLDLPDDYVLKDVEANVGEGKGEKMRDLASEALRQYTYGHATLERIIKEASGGREYLDAWMLAADALVHRAKSAIFLFDRALGNVEGDGKGLIEELDAIEGRFRAAYNEAQRPCRSDEIAKWVFRSLRYALERGKSVGRGT